MSTGEVLSLSISKKKHVYIVQNKKKRKESVTTVIVFLTSIWHALSF